MKYIDRTYPYPVFRARPASATKEALASDDFPEKSFKFDSTATLKIEGDESSKKLALKVEIELKHGDLEKIIHDSLATIAVEVLSPATLYRRVHLLSKSNKIEIDYEELFGQVFVTPLVIMRTTAAYAPKNGNAEFGSAKAYSLESGDILAVADTTTFNIAFDFTIGDDSVQILPSDELDDYEYQIAIIGPQINIFVGQKLNSALQIFDQNSLGRALTFTNMYKDCVLFALVELQRTIDEPQESWAQNLLQNVEGLGVEFTTDTSLIALNSIAQKLLDSKGMRKVVASIGK
jgi:hypothetical protein